RQGKASEVRGIEAGARERDVAIGANEGERGLGDLVGGELVCVHGWGNGDNVEHPGETGPQVPGYGLLAEQEQREVPVVECVEQVLGSSTSPAIEPEPGKPVPCLGRRAGKARERRRQRAIAILDADLRDGAERELPY